MKKIGTAHLNIGVAIFVLRVCNATIIMAKQNFKISVLPPDKEYSNL